jgi:hypothetical protein
LLSIWPNRISFSSIHCHAGIRSDPLLDHASFASWELCLVSHRRCRICHNRRRWFCDCLLLRSAELKRYMRRVGVLRERRLVIVLRCMRAAGVRHDFFGVVSSEFIRRTRW